MKTLEVHSLFHGTDPGALLEPRCKRQWEDGVGEVSKQAQARGGRRAVEDRLAAPPRVAPRGCHACHIARVLRGALNILILNPPTAANARLAAVRQKWRHSRTKLSETAWNKLAETIEL